MLFCSHLVFIHDGDTKGYMDIRDCFVEYGYPRVVSYLDINHVLKNVPKHIDKLRSSARIVVDGTSKKITGRGRVTEEYATNISKYLANTVWSHVHSDGEIGPMRDAIMAVRHHKSSTNESPMHE